ncbi:MAG: TIGR04076 family protein [Candidatus Abyssobacteria bacterium SURF_17]|uniref:TIGR04076 family protein n=1 Tax=Candidatus Abyssobacteria bacterium SURF_17 TaxID=2093361 RepID=A0A419ENK4_9BACT|nr:MAG: TIGR04076 family protein [Candidatus Abyssubacteria bacterium SURF_17]
MKMTRYSVKARVARILEAGECPLGIKVGDEFDLSRNSPPLCHWAYNALYPVICIFTYGGTLPWGDDPDRTEFCCPDPNNPVVFEIWRELQGT